MTNPMQRLDDDFARMLGEQLAGLTPPRAPEPMPVPPMPIPEFPAKNGGREL